ncbi:hypothetical protein HUJ04_009250 [Dendroctonus ponderosae]|nr:hypothetical protein HUJ04_009250 [Dendroctonus ponderosae]
MLDSSASSWSMRASQCCDRTSLMSSWIAAWRRLTCLFKYGFFNIKSVARCVDVSIRCSWLLCCQAGIYSQFGRNTTLEPYMAKDFSLLLISLATVLPPVPAVSCLG